MNDKLTAAQQARSEANTLVWQLNKAQQDHYERLIAPAKEALRAAEREAGRLCHAEFYAKLVAAQEALRAAERAVGDECADAARQWCEREFYPVGTRVRRWKIGRWHDGWQRTSEIAEVQIYRQGDPLPDGVRWSTPNDGDAILRAIRKDGTVGIKVERHPVRKEWLPEAATEHPENAAKVNA